MNLPCTLIVTTNIVIRQELHVRPFIRVQFLLDDVKTSPIERHVVVNEVRNALNRFTYG